MKYKFTINIKKHKNNKIVLGMLFGSSIAILNFFIRSFNECSCSQLKDEITFGGYKNYDVREPLDNKHPISSGKEMKHGGETNGNESTHYTFKEINWSFYLINFIDFDVFKLGISEASDGPIKQYKIVNKFADLSCPNYMKEKYPLLDWTDDVKIFQKVTLRLRLESKIADYRFKLKYGDPNYKIKTSKILIKDKLKENLGVEIGKLDDYVNINSILSQSYETIYFFEIYKDTNEVVDKVEEVSNSTSYESEREKITKQIKVEEQIEHDYNIKESEMDYNAHMIFFYSGIYSDDEICSDEDSQKESTLEKGKSFNKNDKEDIQADQEIKDNLEVEVKENSKQNIEEQLQVIKKTKRHRKHDKNSISYFPIEIDLKGTKGSNNSRIDFVINISEVDDTKRNPFRHPERVSKKEYYYKKLVN